VVLIGGGYASVMAATRLTQRDDLAVTVINPRRSFVERIRLHQLRDHFRGFRSRCDTRTAVTRGLARTAKVVTTAAAIMIAVFTTALLGPDVSVKQIGLGRAVAVLINATIVRMILVPAVMELCGKANW